MSQREAKAALAAKRRVESALEALRVALTPYVTRHMKQLHGDHWRHHISRARGADAENGLDVHALLKTLLDNWSDHFRYDDALRRARSFISIAMDARNAMAHFSGDLNPRVAIRYLDGLRELAEAVGATQQVHDIDRIYQEQHAAGTGRAETQLPTFDLDEPAAPERLRPWREVCDPHPDVLEARFSDSEFAADLARVDQGEGSEEYVDPKAFFRITYLTEGLRQVLTRTLARLTGEGGEPVIGLQTNFGGGKTHTMLALYHLAGAAEAGYRPEDLEGLAPIFEAAGVETLGPVRRAVFSGTHKGAAEAMYIGNGREIRTLWGYIAWRLGGWPALEKIAASEDARTNPGSERLIPILRDAAPCLILMDELVAFARQLRDLEYDAFHAFMQSLTEAAAAVKGVVVIGSLPESGAEVGNQQGRDALERLEKIFGRVQSSWTPASGVETFEIVRRRLFQPLDESGEKARDTTLREFRKLYRDHRADFPPEVREKAYEDQMRRAYPLHPDVLRRFSGDWSVLEKFQRTRGILKIMANAVYALWAGESAAPLITPALLPFRNDKVRTALLEPLDNAYDAILQTEVDGDQALSARIEMDRPRFAKTKAARSAARAVFFATAPHAGAPRSGMSGAEIRLACAQPGDQIGIFAEALEQIAARSAHLHRDGDSYRYSPQMTLNKLVGDRARDVSEEQADQRIIEFLRSDLRSRGGFPRVHVAPDNPTDIEDNRSTALVILPPSVRHDAATGTNSSAAKLASEVINRRGGGQRMYRNAVVFAAADAASIDTVRENARRERAWLSILKDDDLMDGLTRAQTRDAETQAEHSRQSLEQSARSAWAFVLYPVQPEISAGGTGYVIGSTRLINRGGRKQIAEAVWDKVSSDGTVHDTLGPTNLERALEDVWPKERPHLSISEIRDWFASYFYLPRLRDDATLDSALEELCADMHHPYAYAASFDGETGFYEGVVDKEAWLSGGLGAGLLVRREAVRIAEPEPPPLPPDPPPDEPRDDEEPPHNAKPQPTRFFASITIDPERAGIEVARIMDGLLVELTRTKGSTFRLTLELEGEAPEEGYPKDVIEIVTDNARDLKIDRGPFGFEE